MVKIKKKFFWKVAKKKKKKIVQGASEKKIMFDQINKNFVRRVAEKKISFAKIRTTHPQIINGRPLNIHARYTVPNILSLLGNGPVWQK